MQARAVVLHEPGRLEVNALPLTPPNSGDVVVDVAWSGISTGTERLLWSGRMPQFPGMGYPLVPGYESAGRVSWSGSEAEVQEGDFVFVPGATCYGPVRGLFGGAASKVVVPGKRVVRVSEKLGERATLLALAATAYHAARYRRGPLPELIVGHGVLGRLLARIVVGLGGAPVVWESAEPRLDSDGLYPVVRSPDDKRRDYKTICDASGDGSLLDTLIARLAPGGDIVLAGFYAQPIGFAFAPAFMREARIGIAAQWSPSDMSAVLRLISDGRLSLDGLITHRDDASNAPRAYEAAFGDAACLKMILNWGACA
jgi:3-hydroxyethyl bacteriochlorophyllide a dehydrogenase